MHIHAPTLTTIALALLLATTAAPTGAMQISPAPAGQPEAAADLPDAASLFEAYIEASGGMENHLGHKDRVMHGVYTFLSLDDTQILTIYAKSPNSLRAELESPGVGLTLRCTNGTIAWGTNVVGAPFELSEQATKELLDGAVFIGEAGYKDHYESITTVGSLVLDGRPAYRVDFVTKSGLAGSVYFDPETGLVAGRQLLPGENTRGGPLVLVKDYQEFDGVLLPTFQRQLMGQDLTPTVEVQIKWVEINTGKLPSFDPPGALDPTPDSEK